MAPFPLLVFLFRTCALGLLLVLATAGLPVAAQSQDDQEWGCTLLLCFANPAGLSALGDNFLNETAASGPAQVGPPGAAGRGTLKQGMLEASNVNVVQELVDMIECQRAYEINSKMISAVDEMLKNANQTL